MTYDNLNFTHMKIDIFKITLLIKEKIRLIFLFFLISLVSYAQIGIGTNTPSSKSILDVSSTNSGVLLPRVTTAQRSAIAPNASDTSLKVYDSTTKTFWYWDGTVWVEQKSAPSTTGWNLQGNSSTSSVSNFIGTTDFNDFVIRTNNIERTRLTTSGNFGIGTSLPSTKLHIVGSGSPALRIQDGSQGVDKVLTSDAFGNANWQFGSSIVALNGMRIPICNTTTVGSSGSFVVSVLGVSTTVTWTILARDLSVASFPSNTQRLQVRYDFSPMLPFYPNGLSITSIGVSGSPDTFTLNYASKSQSSIIMNINRVDVVGTGSACWTSQFYFDALLVN